MSTTKTLTIVGDIGLAAQPPGARRECPARNGLHRLEGIAETPRIEDLTPGDLAKALKAATVNAVALALASIGKR